MNACTSLGIDMIAPLTSAVPRSPSISLIVVRCCCDACRLRAGACMPCYSPYLTYICLGVPRTALLQEFLPSKMYWDTTKSLLGQGI